MLLFRIDSKSSFDIRGTEVTRSISSLPTLLLPATFPAFSEKRKKKRTCYFAVKAQLSSGDNTVQNQHFESKTDFELSLGVVFFPSVEARDKGGRGVAVGPLNKN